MRPLVVVVAMAVCGAACADTSVPPVAHDRSPADSADQFIIGMQTVLNDAGLKRADILADTAYFFNDNARMEMRGVTANFFTSTGVNEGVLTAHRASYDTRTQIMEALGNVVVTSMDGKRLTTSQLRFNNT